MNNKLIVSGVFVALLAVSMNASAHDITGGTGGESWTYDSLTSVGAPVGEPCTTALGAVLNTVISTLVTVLPPPVGGVGGIIDTLFGPAPYGCLFAPPLTAGSTVFALTLCESDSFLGSGISTPGHGGLCSMSTGWNQATATTCVFAGKSNGVEGDYDADNTCGGFAWPPAGTDDYTFELTSGTPGDVAYQVGGVTCAVDSSKIIVDMQYAMLVDGGHVTAFQNVAGETGSYTVAATSAADYTASAAFIAANGDCSVGFIPMAPL